MRTPKQIAASKANGAKSKGPVSPQGKARSSRNNTSHGLLARSVVLEEESEDRFLAFYQRMFDEFRPSTDSELAALETMAAARWRQLRSLSRKCAFQRVALDRDIAFQDHNTGPAVRAVDAFAAPNAPHLPLVRYEISFDREYARALNRLLELQRSKQTRSTRSFTPDSFPYVWKDDDSQENAISIRTQEVIETKEELKNQHGEPTAKHSDPAGLPVSPVRANPTRPAQVHPDANPVRTDMSTDAAVIDNPPPPSKIPGPARPETRPSQSDATKPVGPLLLARLLLTQLLVTFFAALLPTLESEGSKVYAKRFANRRLGSVLLRCLPAV